MFNISDTDFLNPNKVKIIDSIAGAGKSTKTHEFFRQHNIDYLRLTSTNALKRDAEQRFGIECKTIASGLFTNEFMHYYKDFKDVEYKHIVIDEILQADPKALDYVIENRGKYNFIITTDSHQMLTPQQEAAMMEKFRLLCEDPDNIYVNITDTLRTSDTRTKELYENLYALATDSFNFTTDSIVSMFKTVDEVPYNSEDVFITHTKELEDRIYIKNELQNRYELELVPKGYLASKNNTDYSKYPILSQEQANTLRSSAYLQVANIATPTRYQGSEVEVNQKLYYFVNPKSIIQARELYTVVTRCKNIDSLNIVVVEKDEDDMLTELCKKPIKREIYYTAEMIANKTRAVTTPEIRKILKGAKEYEDAVYNEDFIYDVNTNIAYINLAFLKKQGLAFPNQLVSAKELKRILVTKGSNERKTSLIGLVKRDGALNYSYVEEMYKILNEKGIDCICGAHVMGEQNKSSHYQCDLTSAYPHIFKYAKLPVNGPLSTVYDKSLLNFYIYRGSYLTPNSIVKEGVKLYFEQKGYEGEFEYVFSTPWQQGSYIGQWLYNKVFDTQESKASIKGAHYGIFQKKYFELSPKRDCYIRRFEQKYEILMASVLSDLVLNMLRLRDNIGGNDIVTDAVYFELDGRTPEDIAKIITNSLDSYFHWKWYNNNDKGNIYTNYEPIPTKAQKKADKERERRKNKTDEQKAKEAERKRQKRANMTPEQKAEEARKRKERRQKAKGML